MLHHVLGGEGLIRERHVHHARGMASAAVEVDEAGPTGSTQEFLAFRPARPLVHELADRVGPGPPASAVQIDLDIEVPDFASTAPSFITRMCSTRSTWVLPVQRHEDCRRPPSGQLGHRHHPD